MINKVIWINIRKEWKKKEVYVAEDKFSSGLNLFAESKVNTLPLRFGYCNNKLVIADFCDSKSSGVTFNNRTPKCFVVVKEGFRKSESLVTRTLSSASANLSTSPFEIVLGDNLTSCPNLVKNEDRPICTFSSSKNFILNRKQILSSDFCGEFQGSIDMLLGQGRVSFNDFSDRSSSLQHLQNKINHNSSSLKSGFSMTNLTVNDNVLINFNSHKNINEQEVYKDFELMLIKNSSSMLNNGTGLCIGGC